MVEVEYLIALANEKSIVSLPKFSINQQIKLRKIYKNFNDAEAKEVKVIEETTNHDVKSIEYYIQGKVPKKIHPWIHFALTSEDVNNLAYSLMWQNAMKNVYIKLLGSLHKNLKNLSKKEKNTSMLSLTHGQPATPTTFGKEIAVFTSRLNRQLSQIKTHRLMGKFSGATGTWSAHISTFPKINWITFAEKFIRSLKLEPNLVTTQIEPHDSLAENFHQIIRVNSILTDFCRDIWTYISRNIIIQKSVKGEIGSSTMPHKINPIQFENAEGNLGLANALLSHLATKLPISRMQRDLTDSTVLRNQGVALGHSYLALINILKGLDRIAINKEKIFTELNEHWEVLAEAIQTILRKAGKQEAYEKLKILTRGEKINTKSLASFVSSLSISKDDKETLLSLSPETYIGLAPKLVELI